MQTKVMYKSVWMMLLVSINLISHEESTTLNISLSSLQMMIGTRKSFEFQED